MTDDNVTRLPVGFKALLQEEERSIKVVDTRFSRNECDHVHRWTPNGQIVGVTYLIRPGETEVECGNCQTKLDPMWVLKELAHKESGWQRSQERYQEEMARLKDRSRTKCEACGHMTRISRTKAKRHAP